ncbi:unnamed protein product, partial [Owenia fusiformis]
KSRFKEIVGLVTQIGSQRNQLIANFLNIFSIPQIASVSTSDILSNNDDYPYFSRVVPPDRFQAQAMVDVMLHFGWSYYSMVYSEGAYGANGMGHVNRIAKTKGLCNAYLGMLPLTITDYTIYDEIVQNLRSKKAKVVVLFLEPIHIGELLTYIDKYNAQGEFIWIGSDTFEEPDVEKFPETVHGAFSIQLTAQPDYDFITHYENLTPWNNPQNPWFKAFWELAFDCIWDVNSTDNRPLCTNFKSLTESEKHKKTPWVPLLIDTVYAFGYALDNLIKKHCVEDIGNKQDLLHCVQKSDLTAFIRELDFRGSSGIISFDENGDAKGAGYVIKHFIPNRDTGYEVIEIGSWIRTTETLDLYTRDVYWYNDSKTAPNSICSQECGVGEIKIQLELPCCWDCFKCYANDITINNSYCSHCPTFEWPDESTASTCTLIEPDFIKLTSDYLFTSLFVLASLGMTATLCILGLFIYWRNEKIIKASTKEFIYFLLVATVLVYGISFVYLLNPSVIMCYCGRVGFSIGFTILYAPLLVKVARIYNIFRAGSKLQLNLPKWIEIKKSLIITFALITIQVGISVGVILTAPPDVIKRMPVETEKFVEVVCDFPMWSMIASIVYNLVLVLATAALAFLTRKLPDNFNETLHILLSVCATLFLWLSFVPTYFITYRAKHQQMLFSVMFMLTGLVSILCLFAPKIYAIMFIDESKITFSSTFSFNTKQKSNSENGHKTRPKSLPNTTLT